MMTSIRNKLILAMLGISLISVVLIGIMGYKKGSSELVRLGRERLTSIRIAKQAHVEKSLEELHSRTSYHADSFTITESMVKFVAAFEELKAKTITDPEFSETKAWYENEFVPEFEEHEQKLPQLDPLLPASTAARYLQFRYIVKNPHPLHEKRKLVSCEDGTTYDEVHKAYQEKYDSFLKSFDYEDLLFFHPVTSEVVYSTLKQIELGSSFETGPFARTKLAQAVRAVNQAPVKGQSRMIDFEWYVPAFGHPIAFMICPVYKNDKFQGTMAIAIATDNFNKILFADNQDKFPGLEKTGDIILFGDDGYMRSDSRFLMEDSSQYAARLRSSGISEEIVSKMLNYDSTIMILPVRPENAKLTFERKSGVGEFENLFGVKILASYSVMNVKDMNWAIVATLGMDEIYQGVNEFLNIALIGGSIVVLLSGILAAMAGRAIAAPARQLTQAAKAFSNGFMSVRVHVNSHDEMAELAKTFNAMAEEIENRTRNYKAKAEESRRLLENMLPMPVLARFRTNESRNDDTPYQTEATLAFVEIEGLDRLVSDFGAKKADSLVKELVTRFDAAAEKLHVEKLSSTGSGYLVACGLTISRFDHTPCILRFAQELLWQVATFNAENITRVYLSIGVHRGGIGTGKIGRHAFIHELWGRTIDLAKEISEIEGKSAIRVSREVVDRVGDHTRFEFVRDEIGTEEPAWTLIH
ncbi:HAMP domain-containing protein [bacterium]|nr:HAMP domain-containing protein [bacterium]